MKTDWRDYLLSTMVIAILLGTAGGCVALVQPRLLESLGPVYTPIAVVIVFLLSYGMASAMLLHALQRFYPLRPGRYRLTHRQFRLWKLRHVISELAKGALRPFFPVFMRNVLYALLGARVGKNVAVAGVVVDPELTVLEDGCIIGEGAILSSHVMARGRFVLAEVHVGAGATIGGGAGLMPGVKVGAGAVVLPYAFVEADTVIGPGEVWGGLPAAPVKRASSNTESFRKAGETRDVPV